MWENITETSSHVTREKNARPYSSQLAEPLWTDPGLKSVKKAQAGNNSANLLLKSSHARKKPPSPPKHFCPVNLSVLAKRGGGGRAG